VVNSLLKNYLKVDENDPPAVRRFKQVVTQELLNRFNVEEAIEEECVTVFATTLDPQYHQLKLLSERIKAKAYSAFRKKFTSIIVAEDCQILEELIK